MSYKINTRENWGACPPDPVAPPLYAKENEGDI